MECCNQKGMTISEALAEIIKFIDRLVIDMEIRGNAIDYDR